MRYLALLIGWTTFYTAVEAQSNLPVIFVKGSYYLLSPSGDLMFNEAFSDVKFDVPFKGQLLVNQIGKVGVIENGQYLFRPEFTSITTLHNDKYGRKGYVLEKNKLYGVADGNGKIIYPIRYTTVVRERDVLSNSKRVLALKHGDSTTVVFQKENKDFQTVYSGMVDVVTVCNGMIRIEQGEKSALWTYDESEDQLVAMLPFTKVKVSCSYNSFQVYDPSKKTVRTYSYSNRLLLEKKNVTTFEEHIESADMEGGYDEVQQAVFPEPLILSVDRHDLLTNKQTSVKRYFTDAEVIRSYRELQQQTPLKIKVNAIKSSNGAVEYSIKQFGREQELRETTVSIPADELVKWSADYKSVLVKKQNEFGVFTAFGKMVLPFTSNEVELVITEHELNWYVIKDKKQQTVLFYNEAKEELETVFQVPRGTQVMFIDNVVQLTTIKGKKQTIRYAYALPSRSKTEAFIKLTERSERFESVVPMKHYPGLFVGEMDGKFGVLDHTGKVLIPCLFDSIQGEGYYDFEYFKKDFRMLKPIVKGFQKDSFQLIIPEGNSVNWLFKSIPGRFSKKAIISEDGNVVYEPNAANQFLVYKINGKKLNSEPLWIYEPLLRNVSYNDQFWYVFGQDIHYKTNVLLSNGKRIELP